MNIFPIPIYSLDLKKISLSTYNFLNEVKLSSNSSSDVPQRSVNSYLLKSPELSDLAEIILESATKYAENLYSKSDIEFGISQSWIINKKAGQHLESHIHHNSIISGVFYWQSEISILRFFNPIHKYIDSFMVDSNFNSQKVNNFYFDLMAKRNHLYLFPSYVPHKPIIKDKGIPVRTLSFNLVPKIFGSESRLTELDFSKVIY